MSEAGNASARSKKSCAAADKPVCEIIDHSSMPNHGSIPHRSSISHGPRLTSGDNLEIGSDLWSRSVPIRAAGKRLYVHSSDCFFWMAGTAF